MNDTEKITAITIAEIITYSVNLSSLDSISDCVGLPKNEKLKIRLLVMRPQIVIVIALYANLHSGYSSLREKFSKCVNQA